MLLVECSLGTILHTGDFRFDGKGLGRWKTIDMAYMDFTFLAPALIDFPERSAVTEHLLAFIQRQDPKACICISAEMLGTESILQAVSRHFQARWFVDSEKSPRRLKQLLVLLEDSRRTLTRDPASTRFHVSNREKPLDTKSRKLVYIQPGTQYFVRNQQAMAAWVRDPTQCLQQDSVGVWHLFWSIHSSSNEIRSCINTWKPAVVLSTCGSPKFNKTERVPFTTTPPTNLKVHPQVSIPFLPLCTTIHPARAQTINPQRVLSYSDGVKYIRPKLIFGGRRLSWKVYQRQRRNFQRPPELWVEGRRVSWKAFTKKN
jgi:hypothetical protein